MEEDLLYRRALDLLDRANGSGRMESTWFLTPAQQHMLLERLNPEERARMELYGGAPNAERRIAVFRPEYLEMEEDLSALIRAFAAVTRFGTPTHRDYLGALMGLGITRESIGDIFLDGEQAWFFCLPAVSGHIRQNLRMIGRSGVSLEEIEPAAVPAPEPKTRTVHFTVKSPRLDAVAADMFGLSRSAMAERISAGAVSLNFTACLKGDALVHAGDVISVRRLGKGTVSEIGGLTKKGRLFLSAELNL